MQLIFSTDKMILSQTLNVKFEVKHSCATSPSCENIKKNLSQVPSVRSLSHTAFELTYKYISANYLKNLLNTIC